MARDEVHIEDIGTAFVVEIRDQNDIVVPLQTATTKNIIFKKPNGTKVTQNADFYTNGSDGKIQYISASGDLDVCGRWRLQGYVEIAGSGNWYSDIVMFQVFHNL